MPRERRLARARRGEAVATVLAVLGLPLGLLLGLMFWQYRVMDEFRRARCLRAWAAAGAVGLTAMTAPIVWALALLAPLRETRATLPTVPLPLWALYLPWLAMLVTFFGGTAFLYRRDTRD